MLAKSIATKMFASSSMCPIRPRTCNSFAFVSIAGEMILYFQGRGYVRHGALCRNRFLRGRRRKFLTRTGNGEGIKSKTADKTRQKQTLFRCFTAPTEDGLLFAAGSFGWHWMRCVTRVPARLYYAGRELPGTKNITVMPSLVV